MKYLVIYAHPNKASFNHAIKETTVKNLEEKGHEVRVRDLYKIGFNPVLSSSDFETFFSGGLPEDIKTEHEHIKWAEKIIFISPIWWSNFPAILKGYFDKVFSNGFAYKTVDGRSVGLLTDKKAIYISTIGLENGVAKELGILDSVKTIQNAGILDFVGIKTGENLFFGAVPYVTDEIRKGYLEDLIVALDKF